METPDQTDRRHRRAPRTPSSFSFRRTVVLLLAASGLSAVRSLSPPSSPRPPNTNTNTKTETNCLSDHHPIGGHPQKNKNPSSSSNSNSNHQRTLPSRRQLLDETARITGAAIAAGSGAPWMAGIQPAAAVAAPSDAKPRGPVVAVVGASGRTGRLCVDACLRRGIRVRALTRTGEWTAPATPEGAPRPFGGDTTGLLSVARCDVANDSDQSIGEALSGCGAVIYAASASKAGGTALAVDHTGVTRVASACLGVGVNRCVLISSTATTRPKSLGYVFTNLGVGGNIMGEKRNGERALIEAFEAAGERTLAQGAALPSYAILRPGGLEEPKRNKVLGPPSLELSQGDVFSGIISRADVAELTVELALSEAAGTRNTALELYYTDSVVPVEARFGGLLKSESASAGSKLRLHGGTYEELLGGLAPGIDFAAVS